MVVRDAVQTGLILILLHLPTVSAAQESKKSYGQVERSIKVLAVEHKEDHRIRIHMSVSEESGGVRYPMTTIERDWVRVDFLNTSTPPAEALSLATSGSQAADMKRALFIAFDLDRNLSGRELEEVRERVSEIVTELPAQYLTLTAISQGSARIITDVTPEKSDNINRIQQQLAALPAEGEGPAISDTLCVAAERFHAWNTHDFKASDQKVLVIVSPPGDGPTVERYRAQNCFRSLLEQKVRVYQISFGQAGRPSPFNLAAAARESGGFVHHVNGPLDILAATKNFIAILKNEYILDVNAPDISLEDQPLELKIRIGYHDSVIASDVYNIGFVIPSLAQAFGVPAVSTSSSDDPQDVYDELEQSRKRQFIFIVVGLTAGLVLAYFGWRRLQLRLRTTACNTCTSRVRPDHADCPFRKPECIGRLVMISGPHAGVTYPLFRGPNRISVFAKSGVVLPRGGVRWFNHGTLVADGHKVAYTPTKMHRDALNGWPITEARLLGQGYMLRIGKHRLRLEIKPSALGH